MRGASQRGLLRLIIPDQIPNLLRHAGPTGLAAADFPRPEQAKAFTMPGDNGFSLDDHQGGFPVAPQAKQPDPEDSISGRQFQPFGSRTPQDGELLPQGEVFQSQLARGFKH